MNQPRLVVRVALVSTFLFAAARPTLADGPKTVGAYEPLSIAAAELSDATTRTVRFPGATYVRLHFKSFRLADGDWLEIAAPDGSNAQVYSGDGLYGRSAFWATTVPGEAAVLTLHGTVGGAYGFEIDGAGRGIVDVFSTDTEPSIPGSVCGSTDWKDVACYATSYPEAVESARAVAIVISDCCRQCNAFKVSDHGEFLTSRNCRSANIQDTELWFEMRAIECGGVEVTAAGNTRGFSIWALDDDLDYMLFDTTGGTEGIPCLQLDRHLPEIGERVFIPHHPTGNGQKLSIESDQDAGGFCTVLDTAVDSVYSRSHHTEITHRCDTSIGSLGAPVISAETQKVVGIQHLGGCPTYNSASRMDRIYQQISRRLQGCSNAPNCAPLSNSLCDCNGVCSGKERKFVDGGGVCADCD